MSINNPWIKEEISKEIRKYFELKECKSTTYQNIYDAAKTVFLGGIYSVKCLC